MEVREAKGAYGAPMGVPADEVPVGYQRTEVGVIPEDWEVRPLRTALSRGRLGGNYANRDVETEYPLMKMGNIARGNFNVSKIEFIALGVTPETSHRLSFGDVLFNTRNTLDLVGKVAVWRDELPDAYFNSNLMRLEFNPKVVCSNEYANYALNTAGSVERLRALATGTTSVAAIYTRDLMALPFVVPPSIEQKVIAEALSDADALIESLEQLLAKKRQIKQGTMQELLTGKKRLPGFTEAWKKKSLGDLLTIKHGKSQHDVETENGPYPILATGGEIGRASEFLCDEPSVLIGRKGTIDRPQYMDTPFWTVDTLFYSIVHRPNSARFLFYRFCLIDWKRHNEASGVPSLNAQTIERIEIDVPEADEQVAIAAILSGMDDELDALEIQLTKVCQLKQGMMQELLTGRVRLVQPVSNVVPLLKNAKASIKGESGHNRTINEAVVIAKLTQLFGSDEWPLARVRRTKLAYLLHRHVEGRADGFLKKAAGPYDPTIRYKGPEGVALKNGYVRAHNNGTYEGFVAADNIVQAETYFEKWYGTGATAWLEQFRRKKTDELELLATVDMAVEDLRREGKQADLDMVKRLIGDHPEWKPKLDKAFFPDEHIVQALNECHALFGD